MPTNPRQLFLVDEAQLSLALETSPDGHLWVPERVTREPGTGRDLLRIEARGGASRATFEYHGPTLVGLGDGALERERERMVRVIVAAQEALKAIDGHLAWRKNLGGSP